MGVSLCPPIKMQFFDDNGDPLNGGKIYSYEVGTTTAKATYTDSAGDTANANPVVCDSAGRASIWLNGPTKLILKTSADVTVYTVDNVSSMAYTNLVDSEWQPSGYSPTYVSATSFTVPGDATLVYHVKRRVKSTCTAGTIYGMVTASSYAAGVTTVTVVNDSGSLDSGLSAVDVSIFGYTNPSIRKMPVLDHGTKSTDFTLNMSLADVHFIAFSGAATLTITSSDTNDKSTIVVKNGNNAITLSGIDNNSPTLTTAASKQDFITLVKSFGKISCIAYALNIATS